MPDFSTFTDGDAVKGLMRKGKPMFVDVAEIDVSMLGDDLVAELDSAKGHVALNLHNLISTERGMTMAKDLDDWHKGGDEYSLSKSVKKSQKMLESFRRRLLTQMSKEVLTLLENSCALLEDSRSLEQSVNYYINISSTDDTIYAGFIIDLENTIIKEFPENDVLNIKINDNHVVTKCTVYSDYGVDVIHDSIFPISEFDVSVITAFGSRIVSVLLDHIAFYDDM